MLCVQPTLAHQKVVEEFYANAFIVDNDTLEKYHTVVRDVDIVYSPKVIRELLVVHYNQHRTRDFNAMWDTHIWDPEQVLNAISVLGTQWILDLKRAPHKIRRYDLLPLPQAWFTFIQHFLLPSSNTSYVFMKRAYFIWCIMKSTPFDVGAVIADAIEDTAQATPGILDFLSLLHGF